MSLSVTYTFTAGATIVAAEMNTNFDDIVDYVNTNAILKDASVAFTAVPVGPNSDPTSANQLTRKSYVDAQDTAQGALITALDAELDSKAGSVKGRSSNNGGGDALLVASGAYDTWNDLAAWDLVIPEIEDHWYRATLQIPSIYTNQSALTAFGITVPTRVGARIERDTVEQGRQWTQHSVANNGCGITLVVHRQATATDATVDWTIAVAHMYDENGGGTNAAIRYNANTNYPMTFVVEDLGIEF